MWVRGETGTGTITRRAGRFPGCGGRVVVVFGLHAWSFLSLAPPCGPLALPPCGLSRVEGGEDVGLEHVGAADPGQEALAADDGREFGNEDLEGHLHEGPLRLVGGQKLLQVLPLTLPRSTGDPPSLAFQAQAAR